MKIFTKADILVGGTGPGGRRYVMAKKDRSQLSRSTRSFEENVTRAGPAMGAAYTLVGGLLALGGIGYLIDKWQGSSPWFTVGGLLLGLVVGFYQLVKTAYRK